MTNGALFFVDPTNGPKTKSTVGTELLLSLRPLARTCARARPTLCGGQLHQCGRAY